MDGSGSGDDTSARSSRAPSLVDALIPLVALAALIAAALALFGQDALDGPTENSEETA